MSKPNHGSGRLTQLLAAMLRFGAGSGYGLLGAVVLALSAWVFTCAVFLGVDLIWRNFGAASIEMPSDASHLTAGFLQLQVVPGSENWMSVTVRGVSQTKLTIRTDATGVRVEGFRQADGSIHTVTMLSSGSDTRLIGVLTPFARAFKAPAGVDVVMLAYSQHLATAIANPPAGVAMPSNVDEAAAKAEFRKLLGRLGLSGIASWTVPYRVISGDIQFLTLWASFACAILLYAKQALRVQVEHDLLDDQESRIGIVRQLEGTKANERPKALERLVLSDSWALKMERIISETKYHNLSSFSDRRQLVEHELDQYWEEASSESEVIRFLQGAVPALGFIGTIVGIGAAMLATEGVASSDPVLQAVARSSVSSEIGVAFDTTLVALVLGLALSLVFSVVRRGEDAAIARVRELGVSEATL